MINSNSNKTMEMSDSPRIQDVGPLQMPPSKGILEYASPAPPTPALAPPPTWSCCSSYSPRWSCSSYCNEVGCSNPKWAAPIYRNKVVIRAVRKCR